MMVPPTDDDLWQQIQDGDAEALGLLFDRHGRAIYRYCFRQTADWAAAEDLASVVFLEAWRHRRQELEPGKVLAWLYGVATNVVRNHRRSLRRFEAALSRLPRSESEASPEDDVIERLDDERQMAEILRLIAQLPRRQRQVLALCDWSGLGYEEAAYSLGLPLGTVKSSLSRARSRVRELVNACGHEPGETAIPTGEVERGG